MAEPRLEEVSLGTSFGALEIGTFIAVFLFGIITLQVYCYLREFKDDKFALRLIVVALWFLDLGHTIGVCAEIYRITIAFFGRPVEYHNFRGIGSATLLGGIITMVVQVFFSVRVWRLLPSPFRYIGIICAIVAVVRGGFSTYLAYQAITAVSLIEYTSAASWLITMLLSLGAVIDVANAVSMIYFFAVKRKSALGHTVRMVDRLLGYTIRTGLLTSITGVSVLICFKVEPHTFIWAGIYCFLAKLYTNSFLSALNERQELRKTIATGIIVDGQSSNLERFTRRKPSLSVVVDIKTERQVELQDTRDWEPRASSPPSTSTIDKAPVVPFE